MEKSRIDAFLAGNAKYFEPSQFLLIRNALERLDGNALNVLESANYKDPTTLLILSLFLGSLGVDRFMLGQAGLGVAKLLTCGGCGLWTIIDWFTVMRRTKKYNYEQFMSVAATAPAAKATANPTVVINAQATDSTGTSNE